MPRWDPRLDWEHLQNWVPGVLGISTSFASARAAGGVFTRSSTQSCLRTAEIKRAALEPPFRFDRDRQQSRLTLDDVNDLVGMRTKNDIPPANQDELVSTPFRINFHDV
jgi:hypothetical protein